VIQARELAALVNAVTAPKLVCGDFNEEATDAGVAELISLANLTDADSGGSPTFDSERPSQRIDIILHDPSISIHSVSVLDSQASDHLPLVADVTWSA
jgi:endonuclease/exonuclease/phosphatase family metal-dependent hydrolase